MPSAAAYSIDELRDKILTLLKLNLNIRPCLITRLAQGNQAIVNSDKYNG